MELERVVDSRCETGEGPVWHPDEQVLYYVDIPRGHLYRYDPETDENERVRAGPSIGGYTIQEDGSLLLFQSDGAVTVWDDGAETTVVDEIPEEVGSRFNDVAAGPGGRVYAGTMPPDGRLYRVERDGRLRQLIADVDISNGLGFSPDLETVYFAETLAQTIWQFDYDPDSGDLTNRRAFVSSVGRPGNPDGLTVDADGYVWSAQWNGGCVLRYHPEDGRVVERVDVPARKVSAIAFGGPDYEDAYVTTATAGNDRGREGDGAGAVFRFRPDVSGTPEYRSRVDPAGGP
jgi:D-xylonolactonase